MSALTSAGSLLACPDTFTESQNAIISFIKQHRHQSSSSPFIAVIYKHGQAEPGPGVTTAVLHGNLDEPRSWLCVSEYDKEILEAACQRQDEDVCCLRARGARVKYPLMICDGICHSSFENTLHSVIPHTFAKNSTCVLTIRCPTAEDIIVVANKLGKSVPKLAL